MASNIIEEYELELELKRRELKSSYYEFFKYFWSVIISDELCDNWHIKYLCDELQDAVLRVINNKPKQYDIIINIPPGETKSIIATVMLTPWIWTIAPHIIHMANSHSMGLSNKHSQLSKDLVKSIEYKELFPDVIIRRDKDSKSEWGNTNGGARLAISTGGDPIGIHAHIQTNDDPLSIKHSSSESYRDQAINQVKAMETRKKDMNSTLLILIMQRLHELDPTGYLLSLNRNIKHICLPAEVSDNINPPELEQYYIDGLLNPYRKNRDILEDLKINLGTYGYSGQIMQRPAPAEGGIIKKHWFKTFVLEEIQGETRHFMADTAQTEKKENAPCVILCYVIKNNTAYIVNITRKWLEEPEIEKQIINDVEMYGSRVKSIVSVEPKSTGPSAIQHLKQDTNLNIVEYKYIENGVVRQQPDKEARVRGWAAKCEAGRIKLLEGAHWFNDYVDELAMFPKGTYKDQADVTSMMMEKMLVTKVAFGGFYG